MFLLKHLTDVCTRREDIVVKYIIHSRVLACHMEEFPDFLNVQWQN